MTTCPVCVIGLGLNPDDLTARHKAIIEKADLLVGGRRHLAFFKDLAVEKRRIGRDLKALVEDIRACMDEKSIVVLASGDPLFFGIGGYLVRELGRARVQLYPNVTAAAAAFARLGEPWSLAGLVSLHGRKTELELLTVLREKDLVAVYTDRNKDPSWVARFLMDFGVTWFEMGVCQQLGLPSERISWHRLKTAAGLTFADPNIVILRRTDNRVPERCGPGAPDGLFEHTRGLITKAEVRAVTLAKLTLKTGQIMWDLGAGSGSVGLEAAGLLRHGAVWAVEKNAARCDQIAANRRRFGVTNLKVVHGRLPAALTELPDPQRVFVGGGGRDLSTIVDRAARRLPTGGVLVANTVLLENIQSTMDVLKAGGLGVDVTQVQVSRKSDMPWGMRLAAENPVFVISGEKP